MSAVLDLVVGALKVILAIVFAIICLAIGIWVFDYLLPGVGVVDALTDGNIAVGVAIAGLLIAIATILGPTIASLKLEKK